MRVGGILEEPERPIPDNGLRPGKVSDEISDGPRADIESHPIGWNVVDGLGHGARLEGRGDVVHW